MPTKRRKSIRMIVDSVNYRTEKDLENTGRKMFRRERCWIEYSAVKSEVKKCPALWDVGEGWNTSSRYHNHQYH